MWYLQQLAMLGRANAGWLTLLTYGNALVIRMFRLPGCGNIFSPIEPMAGGFRLGCTQRRNRVARNAKEAMLAVVTELLWKVNKGDFSLVSCAFYCHAR